MQLPGIWQPQLFSLTEKKNLSPAEISLENRGLRKGDFGGACQKAG